MGFEKVDGESGIFEVRKIKVMYEIITLESGYLKKNLDTNKFEIIEMKGK